MKSSYEIVKLLITNLKLMYAESYNLNLLILQKYIIRIAM